MKKKLAVIALSIVLASTASGCSTLNTSSGSSERVLDYDTTVSVFSEKLNDNDLSFKSSEIDVSDVDAIKGISFKLDKGGQIRIYFLDTDLPETNDIKDYGKIIDENGDEISVRTGSNYAMRIDDIDSENDIKKVVDLFMKTAGEAKIVDK